MHESRCHRITIRADGYWPDTGRVRPALLPLRRSRRWPVLRWLFRLRADGVENLPREGGFVLAANHISNFDPWPLGLPLLAAAAPALHGQVGAVLVAARPDAPRGRRLPGAPRRARRGGDRDRGRAGRGGRIVVDVPAGHAPAERARQEVPAAGRTRARRGSRSRAGVPLVPAAIAGTDRLARLGPLRVALREADPARRPRRRDQSEAARVATERDGGDRASSGRRCERPLLVIDGDSLAHRAYHALPKSIRRAGGRPGNALVGFANFLAAAVGEPSSRARCSSAGTRCSSPTYRHERFAGLPGRARVRRATARAARPAPRARRAPSGSRRRRRGLRGGRLPRRGGAHRRRRAAARALVATSDRDCVPARERADDDPPARCAASASSRASARRRCASATASSRSRCRTSSRCAATRPTRSRARAGVGPKTRGRDPGAVRVARGGARGRPVRSPGGGLAASTGESRRWTPPLLSLPSPTRPRPGRRRPPRPGAGARSALADRLAERCGHASS